MHIFVTKIFSIENVKIFEKQPLESRWCVSNNFNFYSSVPNRRAVQNKRAGGKIVSKSINVQTKIRPCRGKFFLKINKRADQNRTAVQDKIDVQGGKFSQNQ